MKLCCVVKIITRFYESPYPQGEGVHLPDERSPNEILGNVKIGIFMSQLCCRRGRFIKNVSEFLPCVLISVKKSVREKF